LGRRDDVPHCGTGSLGAASRSATVYDLPAGALRLPLSLCAQLGPVSLGGGGWTPGPTLRAAPLRVSAVA